MNFALVLFDGHLLALSQLIFPSIALLQDCGGVKRWRRGQAWHQGEV